MNRTLFLFLILSIPFTLFAQDFPVAANLTLREKNPEVFYPISVEYPHEDLMYDEGSTGGFIFGSIYDPAAKLTINETEVSVYKNGAFLAYIPLQGGDFQFVLKTDNGKETHYAVRNVKVKYVDVNRFTSAQFAGATIYPKEDVWAATGDNIVLSVNATPGSEVSAAISGLRGAKDVLLKEEKPGFYRASYKITEEDKAKAAKITFKIYHEPTNTTEKKTAAGKVRILTVKDKVYAYVKNKGTRIRQLPTTKGNLFSFYNLYGTLKITGKVDRMYRVDLGAGHFGWVEEAKIKIVNRPEEPNRIDFVTAVQGEGRTNLVFYGKKDVTVLRNSRPGSFDITFFNTEPSVPLIESINSSLVKDITVDNTSESVTTFKINYEDGQILWGYDFNFDKNGNFILELIHKPQLFPLPGKPLNGAKIMLDPGHSPRRRPPYDGAVGPTGYLEYEASMELAKDIKPVLSKLGAEVTISKTENEQTSLQQRAQRALDSGAHIFISLHYNALPANINPFSSKRGFVIYYVNPHSYDLAKAFNTSYSKNVALPNNGTLNAEHYVTRVTQYPSVLLENAFFMFPEQEEMARDPQKRKQFVKAVYEGILNFYGINPAQYNQFEEAVPAKAKTKNKRTKKKK